MRFTNRFFKFGASALSALAMLFGSHLSSAATPSPRPNLVTNGGFEDATLFAEDVFYTNAEAEGGLSQYKLPPTSSGSSAGITGWTLYNGTIAGIDEPVAFQDNVVPNSGATIGKRSVIFKNGAATGGQKIIQELPKLTAGKTYNVSLKVRFNGDGNVVGDVTIGGLSGSKQFVFGSTRYFTNNLDLFPTNITNRTAFSADFTKVSFQYTPTELDGGNGFGIQIRDLTGQGVFSGYSAPSGNWYLDEVSVVEVPSAADLTVKVPLVQEGSNYQPVDIAIPIYNADSAIGDDFALPRYLNGVLLSFEKGAETTGTLRFSGTPVGPQTEVPSAVTFTSIDGEQATYTFNYSMGRPPVAAVADRGVIGNNGGAITNFGNVSTWFDFEDSITATGLPDGITLDPATYALSGTATKAVYQPFEFTATNEFGTAKVTGIFNTYGTPFIADPVVEVVKNSTLSDYVLDSAVVFEGFVSGEKWKSYILNWEGFVSSEKWKSYILNSGTTSVGAWKTYFGFQEPLYILFVDGQQGFNFGGGGSIGGQAARQVISTVPGATYTLSVKARSLGDSEPIALRAAFSPSNGGAPAALFLSTAPADGVTTSTLTSSLQTYTLSFTAPSTSGAVEILDVTGDPSYPPFAWFSGPGTDSFVTEVSVKGPTPGALLGTVGEPFNVVLSGSSIYSVSVDFGSLPPGITVSNTSSDSIILSGTPTANGFYRATLNAYNNGYSSYYGNNQTNYSKTIDINVGGVPTFSSGDAPQLSGTVDSPLAKYDASALFTQTGLTYSATGLPAGLTIDPTTGIISGTPTARLYGDVTITASNANGSADRLVFSYIPLPIPVVDAPASLTAVVGQSFNYAFAAAYATSITTDSGLPPGLTLENGVISGIPTAKVSDQRLRIKFGNVDRPNAVSKDISFSALGAPNAEDPDDVGTLFASGTAGQLLTYSFKDRFSSDTTGYDASGLPAGLSVDKITGSINGTPTARPSGPVTVTGTNAYGSLTQSLTLKIKFPTATLNPTKAVLTATTDVAFSYTVPGDYIESADAIDLPAGLSVTGTSLNGFTISGTPTQKGSYNVDLYAINADMDSGVIESLQINVLGAPKNLTKPIALTGTAGQAFYFSFAAGFSEDATGFNATGLPAGLTVDKAKGIISGTATGRSVPAVTVKLTGTNAYGTSPAKDLALTIKLPKPVFAIPEDFTLTLTASNSATYVVKGEYLGTVTATSPLPAGLTFTSGTISGKPTTTGTTLVTLAADNLDEQATATLPIVVVPATGAPVFFVSGTLEATGTVGSAFSYAVQATRVTSFAATGLPAGLGINATTGIISGTATARGPVNGVSTVTITAKNGTGTTAPTATKTLLLTTKFPKPTLSVTADTVVTGTVGQPFSYKVTGTYLTSGTATGLPVGLGITGSTSVISDTATATGTSAVTYTGSNLDESTTVTFKLVTLPAGPVITSGTTAAAVQGSEFSYSITTSGSASSYSASGLPAGLKVDTATGIISGTATGFGKFNITLGAKNETTSALPKTLVLTVIQLTGSITLESANVGSLWAVLPLTVKAGVAGSLVVEYGTSSKLGTKTASIPYGVSLSGTTVDVTLKGLVPNRKYFYRVTTVGNAIAATAQSSFEATPFGDINGDGIADIPLITQTGLAAAGYDLNKKTSSTQGLLTNTGFGLGTIKWLGVTDSRPGFGKQAWFYGRRSNTDAKPTIFAADYNDIAGGLLLRANTASITLGTNTEVLGVVDIGYTGAATLLLRNTSTRAISLLAVPTKTATILAARTGAVAASATANVVPKKAVASFVLPVGYLYGGSGDLNGDGEADLVFYRPSTSAATNTLIVTTNGAAFTSFLVTGPKLGKGYSIIGVDEYTGDTGTDWLLYNKTTGDISVASGLSLTKGTSTVRNKAALGITLPVPFYPATTSTGVLTFPSGPKSDG